MTLETPQQPRNDDASAKSGGMIFKPIPDMKPRRDVQNEKVTNMNTACDNPKICHYVNIHSYIDSIFIKSFFYLFIVWGKCLLRIQWK